ncbi:MAG TPA: sugar phosphate isomerase/epimerase [Fimbriimonas sp.]|nr:sugar phosphate isomerase/epimerase [Fimbriimonas sp.]
MKLPIAVQVYSVRHEAQNDLFGVLKEIAGMGYDGVEFAGYYGNAAKDIRKVLDDNNLKAEGTHTPIGDFDDDKIEATAELHKTIGAKFAIIPWLPEEMRNSADACKATGEKLTMIAEKLKPYGLLTGFHCHEGDMRPLSNGQAAWDMLGASTPDDFILQYDTANGMSGGADPVQPILNWPGRSLSTHLKGPSGELVGESGIDWKRVFEACETVGKTQWYVVEHEEESSELTPMQAINQCLVNLRQLGK